MIDLAAFTAWVNEPEAYNWISLVAAVAAALTAVFTGYAAIALWLDRRQRVSAEWKTMFSGAARIEASMKVINGLSCTIDGDRISVRGPVAMVSRMNREKHESWRKFEVDLFQLEVPAHDQRPVTICIDLDVTKLAQMASSWRMKPRLWIAMILWKAFHWRFESGVKVRISATVRRRSATMRPMRLTHTVRIAAPHAMKIAESIENRAASN